MDDDVLAEILVPTGGVTLMSPLDDGISGGIAFYAFWVCVTLIAYVYVGYPLLLVMLRKGGMRKIVAKASYWPSVTLIVSAYNERAVIGEKLDNSLLLDYDEGLLDIVVVSDASTDGTDEVVEACRARGAGHSVGLMRMKSRSGKTLGLNAAVQASTSDVIVFSDANAMYQRDAIRMLLRNFADASVGAVTGASRYSLGLHDPSTKSESTYWSYETWVKSLESGLGSLVGGDGAIYAIRRQLYEPMTADDQSDLVNPLQIVAAGLRNVFEPMAVSYEGGADGYSAEFRRKVRIINQAWLAIWKVRRVLNPLVFGIFSLQVVSHKVLRWLVPWMLVILAVSSLPLWGRHPVYHFAFAGQAALYAGAITGWLMLRWRGDPGVIFRIPYYFVLVNIASAWALMEVLRGTRYATWGVSRQVVS